MTIKNKNNIDIDNILKWDKKRGEMRDLLIEELNTYKKKNKKKMKKKKKKRN
ncbi:hypothetical protein AGMMS49965_26480 [Bacteroidia bacterium]|nr:hypothetical protein AGMMS49965_26480 [Bacteroidia bacterium]